MALTAVLEFGDNDIQRYTKQYLVSDYQLVFDRPYNDFAPEASARCERLEVVVVAPGKNDLGLFKWFSEQSIQGGRLVIGQNYGKLTNDEDTQVIYFEEAQCFSLSEHYGIGTQRRRTLKLCIVAKEMIIDDITYKCR